jgi:hypothetical protein
VTQASDIAELRGERSHFGAWLGVVLLFIVFGLFVAVVIGASPRGTKYERKRAQNRREKLRASADEAERALTSYGWVDKNKKIVRIPIQEAMRITVAESSQHKPAVAGPIEPEAQVGGTQTTAPVAAPQSSPAPSAGPSSTPTAKGGQEPEANRNAATINPQPVAPGTQPGASASPAAPLPPNTQQPNPAGAPQHQPTATPPGTPLPVRGKSP